MINKSVVYKIKFTALNEHQELVYGKEAWVHGFNVCPKVGGSGKTFTDKKIVNRMFNNIKASSYYGSEFKCEIVTFQLKQTAITGDVIGEDC